VGHVLARALHPRAPHRGRPGRLNPLWVMCWLEPQKHVFFERRDQSQSPVGHVLARAFLAGAAARGYARLRSQSPVGHVLARASTRCAGWVTELRRSQSPVGHVLARAGRTVFMPRWAHKSLNPLWVMCWLEPGTRVVASRQEKVSIPCGSCAGSSLLPSS